MQHRHHISRLHISDRQISSTRSSLGQIDFTVLTTIAVYIILMAVDRIVVHFSLVIEQLILKFLHFS